MKRAFLVAATAAMALAQTKPATVALSHGIHAVNDLDTTLKFYQDVFQLNAPAQDFPNAAVPLLTNAPGVTLRLSMMSLPSGPRFELTHFSGLERKPAQARFSDPGAGHLILFVRDLDAVVAAAKKANAPIVTTGGEPVEANLPGGGSRAILMRDPDGFFVLAVQSVPAADAPAGNVHRAALSYTIEDAAATLKFYNGMMGLQLNGPGEYASDAGVLKLLGLPAGTQYRRVAGTFPGSTAPIQFVEFQGVLRTKFHLRVRDPGAPAMAVQVTNLDGMLAEMKAAGINFISANGEVVQFSPTVRNIFVEDPNGVNIELFERQPGAAKGKAK